MVKGYRMESNLDDSSKCGYHKSPLSCENVDWFVDEVITLENKMAFYFKKN